MIDTFKPITTDNFSLSYFRIEGNLQKRITNKKIYHLQKEHTRYLSLEFSEASLVMRGDARDPTIKKVLST